MYNSGSEQVIGGFQTKNASKASPGTRFDARKEMIDESNGLYVRLSNGANPQLSIRSITPLCTAFAFFHGLEIVF